MTTTRTFLRTSLLAAGALCAPSLVHAQAGPPMRGPTDGQILALLQALPVENARAIAPVINALLSDTGSHMSMAPRRAGTAADSARAREIVRTMRASLEPFRDVAAAEKAGYVKFLPWLDDQVVFHYNNMSNAWASATTFDAAKPTSLLYKRDGAGKMVLIGAMYTAPVSSTPDELDARLPLGVAWWHQHVNFCAMSPGAAYAAAAKADSAMAAKWLAIDTREACNAEKGFFLPHLFGWMAHVNAFDGETPGAIWGGEGRDHMHSHHSH